LPLGPMNSVAVPGAARLLAGRALSEQPGPVRASFRAAGAYLLTEWLTPGGRMTAPEAAFVQLVSSALSLLQVICAC
jgi:hypothetical protein